MIFSISIIVIRCTCKIRTHNDKQSIGNTQSFSFLSAKVIAEMTCCNRGICVLSWFPCVSNPPIDRLEDIVTPAEKQERATWICCSIESEGPPSSGKTSIKEAQFRIIVFEPLVVLASNLEFLGGVLEIASDPNDLDEHFQLWN